MFRKMRRSSCPAIFVLVLNAMQAISRSSGFTVPHGIIPPSTTSFVAQRSPFASSPTKRKSGTGSDSPLAKLARAPSMLEIARCLTVRASRQRTEGALFARYDTVETAIAAARAAGGKGPGEEDDKDEGKDEERQEDTATRVAASKTPPASVGTTTPAKPIKSASTSSSMGGWPWSFGSTSSKKTKPSIPPSKKSTPPMATKPDVVPEADPVPAEPDPVPIKADKVATTADPVIVVMDTVSSKRDPVPPKPDPVAIAKAARDAERKELDAKRNAEAKKEAQVKKEKTEAAKKTVEPKKDSQIENMKAAGDKKKVKDLETKLEEVATPAIEAVNEVMKTCTDDPSGEQPEDHSEKQSVGRDVGEKAENLGITEKDTPAPKAEAKRESVFGWNFWGSQPKEPGSSIEVSKPDTIVVVTGASGRVGQLTVRKILEQYPRVLVRAIVTDFVKGTKILQDEKSDFGVKLEIVSADLQSMKSANRVCEGASAVVFCASGFAQNLSPLQRLANAVRLTLNPKSVTDVEGVKDVALALKAARKMSSKERKVSDGDPKGTANEDLQPLIKGAPRFVLLSSAAVTRPSWSAEEKKAYPAAADVPIVKLNPLNILTVKAEGEKELREAGISYAVVRPCGLNDQHPRGRPVFSVGDLAAGRICRDDVADVLARCLGTPEATGKTFEVLSLPGLDRMATAKANIGAALAKLPTDDVLSSTPDMLHHIRQATYPLITQLRPVPIPTAADQETSDAAPDVKPDEI